MQTQSQNLEKKLVQSILILTESVNPLLGRTFPITHHIFYVYIINKHNLDIQNATTNEISIHLTKLKIRTENDLLDALICSRRKIVCCYNFRCLPTHLDDKSVTYLVFRANIYITELRKWLSFSFSFFPLTQQFAFVFRHAFIHA